MKKHLSISVLLALVVICNADLVDFDENNWNLMLKGEWMVEFFAPWCPACKNLAPVWKKFATTAENHKVKVAQIDVTASPSLSGRFFVTALPTIYHVIDGEFRQYRGSRDIDALTVFIQKKDWKKIEPISAWKKPDTIHMTILSYFFKLSHTLKEFNGRLQEEYGLPSWGSYALFAVGTIFIGAVLGLMLVCVVDFLFPPKKASRQSFSEHREKARDGIEDLANDEIEDDPQDLAANEKEEEEDEEDESADEQAESEEQNEDTDPSTSENEEISPSDTEPPWILCNNKNKNTEPNTSENGNNAPSESDPPQNRHHVETSPAEARKRKPRKAD